MELQPIKDKREIEWLLSELRKQVEAESDPSGFFASKGYKFEVHPKRNYNNHRYFVLLADGTGPKQLAFSAWTPTGNGPTLLAKDSNDGQLYVLHTGRPHAHGRPKYKNDCKVIVDERSYFVVGKLEWPSLYDEVVEFYESALSNGKGGKSDRRERGPEEFHIRKEHWVIPKHFKIWDKANTWLEENGYKQLYAKSRADLCVERDGKRAVVEVKPDRSPQSVYTAIGQLLSYQYQEDAEEMILILPVGDELEQIDILGKVVPEILVVSLPQSDQNAALSESKNG
ncbi:hypothetical protein [Notoacmeibacter marinus]|uniref:hypothetical protein n=1 Tax=Notoacmeibacter marinus TaxID=1876515 RepID=UPI0013B04C47|nr:hypothetical protein [Notoacmeibacter marinus]